ncbi:MAG: WD40 repeat domain-containing protein, partial [Cyanobacteria bacterium P01_A01_bin.135]
MSKSMSPEPLLTLQHSYTVHSVSFSPDGQMILIGSADGAAALYRLGGEPVRRFQHNDLDYEMG